MALVVEIPLLLTVSEKHKAGKKITENIMFALFITGKKIKSFIQSLFKAP
jgi:hypothetical protein